MGPVDGNIKSTLPSFSGQTGLDPRLLVFSTWGFSQLSHSKDYLVLGVSTAIRLLKETIIGSEV